MSKLMKCGGVRKFIVINLNYLNKLPPEIKGGITRATNKISRLRLAEGKDPVPEYIVINTDEPYAPEVIEILKRHGHWGLEGGKQ